MKFDNFAWLTLYDENFNNEEYLYHFTSVEKATKILNGDSLKFSTINSTNDTLEAKPKMSYTAIKSDEKLNNSFNKINKINEKYIQLLCFSKDGCKKSADTEYLQFDYSNRGFALPRMWAQYAQDNNGVCFVFNKKKIQELIQTHLSESLIYFGDVIYVNQYKKLEFDYANLNKLFENMSETNCFFNYVSFLKNNQSYTVYNYFNKLQDWSNENEYRFLAFGDNDLFVKGIKDALIGIIIGERIKETDEKIIKFFCDDICEIKKISFSYNGCLLKNIYND